jgi:hypothetical protein
MASVQLQNRFTANGARIAIDCYNFFSEYSPDTIVHSLAFLLRFNTECMRVYKECPSSINVLARFGDIFYYLYIQKDENWDKYMGSVADTYLLHTGNTDLIDRLRTILDTENDNIENIENIENTPIQRGNPRAFHNDNQNVHNSSFNQSILRVAQNLKETYKPHRFLSSEAIKEDIYERIKRSLSCLVIPDTITIVITRIKNDPSNFNIDCTLEDILVSVWCFICAQENNPKDQLIKRLSEEFTEMKSLCATGHLARLINVIQGFTSREDFQVSICPQVSSLLKSHMEDILRSAPEDIIEGLTDQSESYVTYIIDAIRSKIPEWVSFYSKDILPLISDLATSYLGLPSEESEKILQF